MKAHNKRKQLCPAESAPQTSQGNAASLAMASIAFPLDEAPTVIKTFIRDAQHFLKRRSANPPATTAAQRVQQATPVRNADELLEFIEHLLLTKGDVGRMESALGALTSDELDSNGFPGVVANALNEQIGILLTLSKNGSEAAAAELLKAALDGCMAVSYLVANRPNLFKRAAPACNCWPVAWSQSGWSDKGPDKKKLIERLKRLRFGSTHPQKQRGKSSNVPAPGKDSGTKFAQKHRHNLASYAHRMMRVLSDVNGDVTFCVHVKARPSSVPVWLLSAAQLPKFNKHDLKIVTQWFEVGCEALCDAAKGKIETLPGLERVGESARRAFAGDGEGLDTADEAEALKHERNGCKSRLKETFLTKFYEPEKG